MSATCAHERLRTDCSLTSYVEYASQPTLGPSHRVAEIRIRCLDCGAEAHFEGAAAGLSPRAPRTSADTTELRAPLFLRQPSNERARHMTFTVGDPEAA